MKSSAGNQFWEGIQELLRLEGRTSQALPNYDFAEVLPELRARSKVMYLDFREIPAHYPPYKNIQLFFKRCQAEGIDPTLPENRQRFNNEFLERSGERYLIGRYLEDRIEMLRGSSIAEEGRSVHLGIDLFSRDLEPVYSPADGTIVRVDREDELHGYGYYLIVEHPTTIFTSKEFPGERLTLSIPVYSFFGHLSSQQPSSGTRVRKGEQIATLGDFANSENGGWSRHLHYQLLLELPPEGKAPEGYAQTERVEEYRKQFPDPRVILGKIY